VNDLNRVLDEQCKIATYEGPDTDGARRGSEDWLMEEALIRTSYRDFLCRKKKQHLSTGFTVPDLGSFLYPFQRHIVDWALRKGRACIFADCGLGKTPMQLEWGAQVSRRTEKPILILAPLAVSLQTQRQGVQFGIPVTVCRSMADITSGVNITNYEMLHHFDATAFSGIVLDESSILKSYSGKVRNQIIEAFAHTPCRLACTATPSPNDFMELGNHSEFVGAMSRPSMLATFFNHDGGETSKWRLKGHAVKPFWDWVASWAVMLRRPSDLGYSDQGFELPELRRHYHTVTSFAQEGMLFPVEAESLQERRESRIATVAKRIDLARDFATDGAQWLMWGDLNIETRSAAGAIPDAVEICGADTIGRKESVMLGFADRNVRVLVTKPKIAGFGMNWQNCNRMVFLGLSDSYESQYQAERRCWRYGQTQDVDVHYLISDRDGAVIRNIDRKRLQAEEMAEEMIEGMEGHHDG